MRPSSVKPSVCFVALSGYNVISGIGETGHIGGAEVQQAVMSRWLIDNGYSVSFITYDHGQREAVTSSGVRVFIAYDRERGWPGLRFFFPRWSGLWSAMRRADADIYYQRGAGIETGLCALWCRIRGKAFVYGSANDRDLARSLPYLKKMREKLLYRIGLRLANAVITQTRTQQVLLKNSFGISSHVIRNSGLSPLAQKSNSTIARSILWVGRFIRLKRLEFLLDVAETSPDYRFVIVGSGDKELPYVQSLLARASSLSNVEMKGHVPYQQMPEYYQKASIVCSTSSQEGFPNVFVEAWSTGIPVLSTLDPDKIIARSGAGWVAETVEEFQVILDELLADERKLKVFRNAALKLYNESYCASANMPKFESIVKGITVAKNYRSPGAA